MTGDDTLDVLFLWRRDHGNQPWLLDQIFTRDAAGTIAVHKESQPMFYPDGPDDNFRYLWDRYLDGSGGNGYTYEIEGFTQVPAHELPGLMEEREQEPDYFEDIDEPVTGPAPTAALSPEGRRPALQPAQDQPAWVLPVRRRMHRRSPAPAWLHRLDDHTRAQLEQAWGEDPVWGWGIPWLWEALNRPQTLLRPPATPTGKSSETDAAAYWVPAVHLMRYALGWSRPDQGLAAWLSADRPHDDRALQLLDQIWGRDGQLEWLLEWLIRDAPEPSGIVIDWRPLEAWREGVRRQAERSGIANPCTGGTDPLHLSAHTNGPGDEHSPNSPQAFDEMLISTTGRGWYAWLTEHCAAPTTVVLVDLGRLGTFTRSPWTGQVRLDGVSEEWHQAGV